MKHCSLSFNLILPPVMSSNEMDDIYPIYYQLEHHGVWATLFVPLLESLGTGKSSILILSSAHQALLQYNLNMLTWE